MMARLLARREAMPPEIGIPQKSFGIRKGPAAAALGIFLDRARCFDYRTLAMSEPHSQPTSRQKFLIYHLPVVVYAVAIIFVSSMPMMEAPKLGFEWSDKLLHFAEYAIFAFLTYRSFSHLSHRITGGRAFLLSALFLSVFAVLDELHQHYIPGRHPDTYDLIGDLVGALLVLLYLWRRGRSGAGET